MNPSSSDAVDFSHFAAAWSLCAVGKVLPRALRMMGSIAFGPSEGGASSHVLIRSRKS